MPILFISEQYRVRSTPTAWEIQRRIIRRHRSSKDIVVEWKAIRWYASLEAACRGVAELCLRTSNSIEIAAAVTEVRALLAEAGNAATHERGGRCEDSETGEEGRE